MQLPDDLDAIAGQHSRRDCFKCTRSHFVDDHHSGSPENTHLIDDFCRQCSAFGPGADAITLDGSTYPNLVMPGLDPGIHGARTSGAHVRG